MYALMDEQGIEKFHSFMLTYLKLHSLTLALHILMLALALSTGVNQPLQSTCNNVQTLGPVSQINLVKSL